MSRVEENKKLIDELYQRKVSLMEEYDGEQIKFSEYEAFTLNNSVDLINLIADISTSLAVIADKLTEVQQDGEENTAGENVNRM